MRPEYCGSCRRPTLKPIVGEYRYGRVGPFDVRIAGLAQVVCPRCHLCQMRVPHVDDLHLSLAMVMRRHLQRPVAGASLGDAMFYAIYADPQLPQAQHWRSELRDDNVIVAWLRPTAPADQTAT